jgi:hypothetical protein
MNRVVNPFLSLCLAVLLDMRKMFYKGKNCATPAWVADTRFKSGVKSGFKSGFKSGGKDEEKDEVGDMGKDEEKHEDGDMDEDDSEDDDGDMDEDDSEDDDEDGDGDESGQVLVRDEFLYHPVLQTFFLFPNDSTSVKTPSS